MKITSYGGARGVTGSCHLLEVDNIKILIDCGLFQGNTEERNHQPFGFDPHKIDYLILTHPHIDHIGRVPLLVKQGFRGRIITTHPTFDIARIMLLDSANVMREEHKSQYIKALRRGEAETVRPPLYDEDDVREAMEYFEVLLNYHETYEVSGNVHLTFYNAGHILGSAFVKLVIKEQNQIKTLVFSGDLGKDDRLIIEPLEYIEKGEYVYMESTYGNREHKTFEQSLAEFKGAVIESFQKGGNILIPTFALERTQEVLYMLRMMYEAGELPPAQIFLDSPLAISATKLFLQFPEYLNEETRDMVISGNNPFIFPGVKYSQTSEDSQKINNVRKGAIILAGSGMCTGGRIKHHLLHNLWRPESSVIFVGYQVPGTLGRLLVDGSRGVHIYGEDVAVKAKIYTINGFSSHSDQSSLMGWLKHFKDLSKVFLIHGEPEVQEILKQKIHEELKITAHISEKGEAIFI